MGDDARVRERYLPNTRREGMALCLSGGGFRATLFHLGAVRRLHELGVLPKIDSISSVSGGSIFAAFWARECMKVASGRSAITNFDGQLAAPVHAFTSKEMRTALAAKSHFIPINWFRPNVGTDGLTRRYAKEIVNAPLSALPEAPNFVFCATDMVFMVNWIFTRARVGDYQVGYMAPDKDWTIARAVAASSCFPPVFRAMRLGLDPDAMKKNSYRGKDRDSLVRDVNLSDGGVYDNMGLEPVWKDYKTVLVSDGGGEYAFEAPNWPHSQLMRYTSVSRDQALALRRRWLISNFVSPKGNPTMCGTYWSVRTDVDGYKEGDQAYPGYSFDITKQLIGTIRTDLDAFSEGERKILENHGYALANAAIQRHCPTLIDGDVADFNIPHPEYWENDARVKEVLAKSHKRRWFGRR